MAMCMSIAVSGCGNVTKYGGSNDRYFSDLTIDGEKYDLSEEFQAVVGNMVENGIYVVDVRTSIAYDENGKYVNKNQEELDVSDIKCCVGEYKSTNMPDVHTICDMYELSYPDDCEFMTVDGVDQDFDDEDLEELEGYISIGGITNSNEESYIALYMDGKRVDLEEYRDTYEEWLEEAEKTDFQGASEKYLDLQHIPETYYLLTGNNVYSNLEFGKSDYPYFEEEMLFTFAEQEADKALEAGKIQSFEVVRYGYIGGEMSFSYCYYFYDEDWDYKKFS